MWQHVQLSEQIRSRDTLACCWDVKQPTNNNPSTHDGKHVPADGEGGVQRCDGDDDHDDDNDNDDDVENNRKQDR